MSQDLTTMEKWAALSDSLVAMPLHEANGSTKEDPLGRWGVVEFFEDDPAMIVADTEFLARLCAASPVLTISCQFLLDWIEGKLSDADKERGMPRVLAALEKAGFPREKAVAA